ncbi:hypothetical protein R75465_07142 [Paraburkholderia aspalathi]|uniref:DUF3717 domain-containing protein n=1 Tax=Paraburkholderia aspalathi TaxID=1324617 RepID=UPI001AFD8D6A|nr:DUF3717 domain-containing protein [Paraburkholderia aspalathi]CAE6850579.1 hypothetical protein R75465_07142 [Paraburkholderia aspalathi]
MRMYTIADIEAAINYWRAREAPAEEFGLCMSARVLADLYGRMIFDRSEAVAESTLSNEQGAAMIVALDQGELPL